MFCKAEDIYSPVPSGKSSLTPELAESTAGVSGIFSLYGVQPGEA